MITYWSFSEQYFECTDFETQLLLPFTFSPSEFIPFFLITQLSVCVQLSSIWVFHLFSVSVSVSFCTHMDFRCKVFVLMTVVLPPPVSAKDSTTCLIPLPLGTETLRHSPAPGDVGSSLSHSAPSQRLTPQAPVCLGEEVSWQEWLNSQGQTVHSVHTCQDSRNAEFTVRDE